MKYSCMSFGKRSHRIELLHLNKPIKHGLAGMITSKLFKDAIAIVIDYREINQTDYAFACFAVSQGNIGPRILMTPQIFYDIKRGKPEARTILLHELGHYCHGDLETQNPNRDVERQMDAAIGKVSDAELRADQFAAEYLGVTTVLQGLSNIKAMMSTQYADYDEESLRVSLQEIDLRIAALKSKQGMSQE